ncbi:hypothetical protein B0H11DRAFT_2250286 [Mycena galericulata]|nr:hypothetical protein B0H11DRAFT_2250286 [Mycena galericulata]
MQQRATRRNAGQAVLGRGRWWRMESYPGRRVDKDPGRRSDETGWLRVCIARGDGTGLVLCSPAWTAPSCPKWRREWTRAWSGRRPGEAPTKRGGATADAHPRIRQLTVCRAFTDAPRIIQTRRVGGEPTHRRTEESQRTVLSPVSSSKGADEGPFIWTSLPAPAPAHSLLAEGDSTRDNDRSSLSTAEVKGAGGVLPHIRACAPQLLSRGARVGVTRASLAAPPPLVARQLVRLRTAHLPSPPLAPPPSALPRSPPSPEYSAIRPSSSPHFADAPTPHTKLCGGAPQPPVPRVTRIDIRYSSPSSSSSILSSRPREASTPPRATRTRTSPPGVMRTSRMWMDSTASTSSWPG